MIRTLGDGLAIASIGAVANSIVRLILVRASSGLPALSGGSRIASWLVVVPSRGEGDAIAPTLRSIQEAARGFWVRVLVLLDGEDQVTQRLTESLGFDSVTKEPPGPTKAAALRWLARERGSELLACNAVLLLDVGSTLSPGFFDSFLWPTGAEVVQCFLSGRGTGVGKAATASENFAQHREDLGRERFGWNIRLRGTGTAFWPPVFIEAVQELTTHVEDLEQSLLLAASGRRLMMGSPSAAVFDEKPDSVDDATMQRSRWMAGQIELLVKRWRAFAKLIIRAPAQGIAFLSEIFARPLSLTVPLRLLAGALLLLSGGWVRIFLAVVLILSAASDILLMRTAAQFGWRESATLAVAWIRAIAGVPRAFVQWRRARKS